ncbi:MAG: IS66 family transposase [Proteobacteria bacterium]|nr:IS66 family transposase [Pseudomonadota bacterium]
MTDVDIKTLPNDPEYLKTLLANLSSQFIEQLQDKDTQLQNKDKQLAEYVTELRFLREQVNLLIHKRFSASSEKYKYPGQHELFDEVESSTPAEAAAISDDTDPLDECIEIAPHSRKKPGRKPLPADLPRVEIIYDLSEEEKVCAEDGHALHKIGEEISEQLEIIPAQVRVIRHIRYKYACRRCETGITTAPMPAQVIPKSIATPGLLAYVATAKYVDSLPLYRQSTIFKRLGVELNRATLANWMIRVAEVIAPLIELMQADLKDSAVIHMDETPVQVLREPDRPATSKSYMWVSMSGAYDPAMVLYEYDPSRGAAVPERLLDGYQGYLVTDAYKGYASVTNQGTITGIGCWAHVRRKFDEALKVQGKSKTGKAQYAMNEIRKLYAIERQIQNKPPDEKQSIRQARAGPILQKLRSWLQKSLHQVPPKTVLGKALTYTDNEWHRLVRYIEDGELPIDNNRCENAIRPFVVGRKNWLFSNSQQGVRASAAIYSLIETAKHNDLEPYRYLRYVLTELPEGEINPVELLPYNLSPAMLADQ